MFHKKKPKARLYLKDLECTAWCLWTYLKNTLLLLLQIQAVQSILDSWYLVSRLLRNPCVHWLFFFEKKNKTVGGLEVKWVKRKDQSIKFGKLSQVISWEIVLKVYILGTFLVWNHAIPNIPAPIFWTETK